MDNESKEFKQGYEACKGGYNRNFYDPVREPEKAKEWSRGWKAYFNMMKAYYK